MLTSLFPRTHAQYRSLPVVGGVLEELCAWLQARGFPPHVIRRRVLKAAFLDQFLRSRGIRCLSECTVAYLRECLPRGTQRSPQIAHALGQSLLEYLHERGALTSPASTPSAELLGRYREYLSHVRGLAPGTVACHARIAGRFLCFVKHDEDVAHLSALQVRDLDAFVADAGLRVGRLTMQQVTAVLRSFLRFLAAHAEAPSHLGAYVESPRHYRGERLPRALPWTTVLTLLHGVDRSTHTGRRDYAMLLLVATYGLRASEVASLRLDDIHWRARVIVVPRPKIGSPLAVPLTDDVATALVDYLRVREAPITERRVFLRVLPPAGPIKRSAVLAAFQAWTCRLGIVLPARGGPHCLRHSLAMHLLRQGTSLKTIGDLLGHRSVESTAIYLRLNVDDLRGVALPYPKAEVRS